MALVLYSSSSSKRLFFKTIVLREMLRSRNLFGRTTQSFEGLHQLFNLQHYHRNLVFYSSPAKRNEDNGTIKKAAEVYEFEKNASSTYSESVWESFFATPYKWYDCRKIKRNRSSPDFRHIDTRGRLWIESHKTPTWALYKINSLGREAFAPAPSMEALWKILFADPSKWVDNRNIKKSNNNPDFTNKDTKEALWIDNKNSPAWITPMLNDIQREAFAIPHSIEYLWKALVADPSKWFDNRKTKKNNNYPDFKSKSKSADEALWIDDRRTPTWVTPMLKKVHDEAFATSASSESLWKTFFADPSKWFDDRKIKKSYKHPDFKCKDTKEALWLSNIKTPSWVTPMLSNLQDDAFAASPPIEGLWDSFFADPSKWLDNRKIKKSNKYPDFMHKVTHEALWIKDIKTPLWVNLELSRLGNDAFAKDV